MFNRKNTGGSRDSPKATSEDWKYVSFDALKQEAVSREVSRDIRSSLTMWGIFGTGGLLSLLAALGLLSIPGIGIVFFGVCGAAGAMITYIVNSFFRREKLEGRFVENVRAFFEYKTNELLRGLQDELKRLSCSQGSVQITKLAAKFNKFKEELSKKLGPSDSAHIRYLALAQQGYMYCIDNLRRVASSLSIISLISETEVSRVIARLKKNEGRLDADDLQELQAAENELRILEEQKSVIRDLLSNNEQMLASLTEMTVKVSEIQEEQRLMEFESLLKDFTRFADMTSRLVRTN